MFDLICLGNVTIDDIILSDGTVRWACLGGDAIYAGLAARLWSDSIGLVAPVGRDFPTSLVQRLAAAGFDTTGLPGRNVMTRHNRVTYEVDRSRQWTVLSPLGDFRHLSPGSADIPPAFLDTRFALVLAMDLGAQEELVATLAARGVKVALDPQEDYVAGNEARILRMLDAVTVFLPSEVEVERLLGHRDHERAARQFAGHGCAVVAIKRGAEGVLVYDAGTEHFLHLPPAPARVIDTTGAGNSFSGGFMAVYARTGDLSAAARAGLIASAFAIEDFGLNHLFDVTREQATERLDRLRAADTRLQGALP